MVESIAYDKSVVRELSRRRVFVFVAAFLALALFADGLTEADILTHALDDFAIVALSIIVLILIAVWRKKVTLSELKKQHNIITILFVVMLIFKLYAVTVEMNDPQDFGDEIPSLIGIVLTLLNRVL
jgi:drug/metabolite transporter (DMT)-like permease